MSDKNESPRSDASRTPPSTEQLRIVGAEEAAALVGRADSGEAGSAWAPESEQPRSPRRAVFESIPDAPAELDELPMSRSERWAGGPGRAREAHIDVEEAGRSDRGVGEDMTVLGSLRGARSASMAAVPDAKEGERLDADAEDLELPHWTVPPTGQLPRVLADDSQGDDAWSTYASAPRWRGDGGGAWSDDLGDVADLAEEDDEPAGALADRERPAIDQFFAFDEFGEDAPAKTMGPRAARRAERNRESPPGGESRPVGEGIGPRGPVGSAAAAGRNVPVAVALGVGLAALAIALFRIGPAPTMVFVLVILGVGAAEFFDASRRGGYRPATLLGLAASVGLPAAVYWRGEVAFPVVIGLTIVAGLLWFLFGIDQEQVSADLGLTLVGVAYVGGLGSFAALILRAPGVDTTRVLLGAVVAVVAHDVLGYVVGRNAGRSPLMAHVSPHKTVEGLLAGALGAVIASVVFNQLLGSNPWEGLGPALELGLVVAVMAPLGDLAESLLKRDLGVKDMGTVLPGHGGVLDRFDALLFSLPGVYYLALLLDVLPH